MPDINTSAFIYDDTFDDCITSSIDDINPFTESFLEEYEQGAVFPAYSGII